MRLAGIILAGGRSSRMGEGRNKALLPLAGETLLARALARLAPQVDRIALSANGPATLYGATGVDIVPDADDSRSGPLAGILAGLRWVQALDLPPDAPCEAPFEAMVSVAVDTPFFPEDLAARLAAASEGGRMIAVAAAAGARHPTAALWPLAIADALARYLADGERRAGAFIARHPHVAVDFPAHGGRDPFFNVNTPADLAEAEEILRGQAPVSSN